MLTIFSLRLGIVRYPVHTRLIYLYLSNMACTLSLWALSSSRNKVCSTLLSFLHSFRTNSSMSVESIAPDGEFPSSLDSGPVAAAFAVTEEGLGGATVSLDNLSGNSDVGGDLK